MLISDVTVSNTATTSPRRILVHRPFTLPAHHSTVTIMLKDNSAPKLSRGPDFISGLSPESQSERERRGHQLQAPERTRNYRKPPEEIEEEHRPIQREGIPGPQRRGARLIRVSSLKAVLPNQISQTLRFNIHPHARRTRITKCRQEQFKSAGCPNQTRLRRRKA